MNKDLFYYSVGTGLIGAPVSLYQLIKLNGIRVKPLQFTTLCSRVLPVHIAIKTVQIEACTPFCQAFNPWVGFALSGIIQGGVYGQLNIFYSKALKISKVNPSYIGCMRGWVFAALRDTGSQGIPYMFSNSWGSLIILSITSTYLTQFVHNCQTTMHVYQDLGYSQAIQKTFKDKRSLYKGAEARIGLLLMTNIMNDMFLPWKKKD